MNEFLDFLVEFLGSATGIVLVLTLLVWFWLRSINRRLQAELERIVSQAENHTIPLEIEIDNGEYYCYNALNKQFVCQGNSARAVKDAFRARYPLHGAWLAGDMNNPMVAELVKELMELKNENSSSK